MRLVVLPTMLLMLVTLGGCGQKGPLYFPDQRPASQEPVGGEQGDTVTADDEDDDQDQ